MANVLKTAGAGGGSGPNSLPLASCTDAFIEDLCACMFDIFGAGFVVRADHIVTQNAWKTGMTAAQSWGSPNDSAFQRVCYWAAKYGGNVIGNHHHAKYNISTGTHWDSTLGKTEAGSTIPHIFPSGKMDGLYDSAQAYSKMYVGPTATFGAGSNVTLQSGLVVKMPSTWPGVLFNEPWNEINSIGNCNGLLGGTGGAGTATRLADYDRLGALLLGAIVDAWHDDRTARGWGNAKFSWITSGSIDMPYMTAVLAKRSTLPANADATSVHVYQFSDPMADPGGSTKYRTIDTIQTHMRPLLKTNSSGDIPRLEDWITELGFSGHETWNLYQTYNGVAGVGLAHDDVAAGSGTSGRIGWPRAYADGPYTHQSSGDKEQPYLDLAFLQRAEQLNKLATNPTKITLICRHIGLTDAETTQAEATQTGGQTAWHRGRAFAQSIGHRYVRASGNPSRSTDWKPVAGPVHDWWKTFNGSGSGTPPVLTTNPPDGSTVNIPNGTTSEAITGQATDTTGITSVKVNGSTQSLDGSGNFSTTVTGLAVGSNTITVVATNTAGLTTTSTITVQRAVASGDNTPPTVTVNHPPAVSTTVTNPTTTQTVDGTATDASGIFSLKINGAEQVPLGAGGAFSKSVALSVGSNSITIVAIDNSSNRNTKTLTYTVTRSGAGTYPTGTALAITGGTTPSMTVKPAT